MTSGVIYIIPFVFGDGKRANDLTGEMAERVKAVVYEYTGRVSVAAAIGVLAILQREILDEQ